VCNVSLDSPVRLRSLRREPRHGRVHPDRPADERHRRCGLIHFALRRSQNIHWQAVDIHKASRAAQKGQKPCVLWLTGLSGAGKSTIANLVEKQLYALGKHTYLLDGDKRAPRPQPRPRLHRRRPRENIRRVAEVSRLMVDAGLIVLVSFILPFRAERRMARALFGEGEFSRCTSTRRSRWRRSAT